MSWTPSAYKALSRWRVNCKCLCLSRVYDIWGQYRRGPGCCSYLEHSSSTDCAFSFLSNSLPVFCLLFRHSISFQPFGFLASNLKSLVVFLTLLEECSYLAPES